jgi:hypothetical protein
MEFTDVTMDCYGVTPTPDTEEYRIEATVDAAGELPTTAIFVFAIGDKTDVASDTFARVAYPQDLNNLYASRDTAIAADVTEYLASYASFQYTDLDIAVGAKAMLKTRINDLVKRWETYDSDFTDGSGESQPYPSSDPAVEEELQAAYVTARDDTVSAEKQVTSAETALQDARDDVDTANKFVETYQSAVDFLTTYNATLYDYMDNLTVEGSTAAGIRNTSLTPVLSAYTSDNTGKLQYWLNSVATAEQEVSTAKQDKIEAEQELAAAQAAEDKALADMLACCPNFDPATV